MDTTATARRNKNRDLGRRHRSQRTRLLATLTDGTPCWWCGHGMYHDPDDNPDHAPLDADHSTPRAAGSRELADRLLHSTCNKSRGDGARDHLRPALATSRGGWAGNRMDWT